jgi:hypothetical protein
LRVAVIWDLLGRLRKKTLYAGLLIAGATAGVASWLSGLSQTPGSALPLAQLAPRAEAPAGGTRFAELPGREMIDELRGDLFAAPSPTVRAAVPARVVDGERAAPAMPYRVAGKLAYSDGTRIVLAKGDRLFLVREGDMLEDDYRIVSVRADAVTLLYMPLGVRQELAMDFTPAATSAAAPAAQAGEQSKPVVGAAKLRWEGPERVREGDTFDVTLRVSSEQPVRALPLQLSYDAKLLEPVGVRPGSFFAYGNFNYHVSPNGSILVGGFGAAAVPSDAEIVVLSFRPIRAGATADLVISSVTIQGAEGRAIVPDRPIFRTNIIP